MKTVEQLVAEFSPSEEQIEGYERLQRLDRRRETLPRFVGTVARGGQIRPWQDSAVHNGRIVAAPQTHTVDWGLAPVRKRTPAERLADVTGVLAEETIRAFRANGNRMCDSAGRCVIPRSVLRDVQSELFRQGTPVTIEQLERFTEDQIRPLMERYAAALLQRCESKYEGNKPAYRTDVATGRVAV